MRFTLFQRVTLISALLGFSSALSQTGAGSQAPMSPADQRIFNEAMTYVNNGNTTAAEPLLQSLHQRVPRDFDVDETLGIIYAGQGKMDEAIPLLMAATNASPGSDVAHANLGTAYLKSGESQKAAAELERAAALNPQNPATLDALGQTYMVLKQPSAAAAAFARAVPLDKNNADLLYNAALAYFQAGDARQAEPLLERMPGVEQSAQAQALFGDIDEKLGKYKTAGEHYARAAQLEPSEPNVYMLGIEFLRHWTFDPAAKEFEAGARQFPASTRMKLGLGMAYYGAGKYDQAIPVFAFLLEAHPEDELYGELLGRNCTVLTEGVRPECAQLADFASRHPKNAQIATYAAMSILHRPSDAKELDVAERLLKQAAQADPALPQAHYGMGLLLQMRSQWAQSITELDAAIRFKPNYASAHYRLALAYSHIGQHAKAQAEIALEQKYSAQEKAETQNRLKSVTTFLVNMQ